MDTPQNMNLNQTNSAEELANIIIDGIKDKKAEKVVKLDLTGVPNAICKYFIICHGNSKTQVEAIADSAIEKAKKEKDEKPWQKEGYENAEWILLDYVDVVLHVFQPATRDFYKLEELWADAVISKYEDEQ